MMESKGISKLDLKRRNRKQILLSIRENGTLARVDIAKKLNLTRAAVTIITNQMISEGNLEDLNTVQERDNEPKRKGRKKTMIRINPNFKFALGAAVTADYISIGLSNLDGEVLDKSFRPIKGKIDQREIVQFILSASNELMAKSSLTPDQVLGLGIGIAPERWKQMHGTQTEFGMDFQKIAYYLEMELNIPVCCDSLITLYALANIDHVAQSRMNQLLLCSGEEYHIAFITDGRTDPAANRDSASVNRFIVTPNGDKAAGYPNGSVHAELIRPVLLKKAAAALETDVKKLTFAEIEKAYADGNKKIVTLLNRTAEKIAQLIINYAVMYRAERVILQDFALSQTGEKLIRDALKKLSGSDEQAPELVTSPLTPEHSFLAGSALAVEALFFETGGLRRAEPVVFAIE
ncbi:MAG: ROK family transcriptional regulator [Oscillospiraceae bacterium]|nr:ROK family transcriptional regulator [Oscillospiraceae bacterium]